MLTQIVAHCRAGFEAETARDLTQIAAAADATIDPIVTRDSALVTARIRDAPSPTFGRGQAQSRGGRRSSRAR